MINDPLLPLIKEVDECNDAQAKELVAELFIIDRIPEDKKIGTQDLINKIVDDAHMIQDKVPGFDVSSWSQETIIDTIDFLICIGVIDGPMVEADESDKLLEGMIGRSEITSDYSNDVRRDLFEYDDNINSTKET